MSVTLMAKGKKGSAAGGPEPKSTGSIRIKPDLAYKLRIIVEADKTSAAVFLDPIIRQVIEMNFKRVTDHLSRLAKEQSDPPK